MYKYIATIQGGENLFAMKYSAPCTKQQLRNTCSVTVTFLAGYDFLLKLKAQIVEMVSLPVLKKHFSNSYLKYKQQRKH